MISEEKFHNPYLEKLPLDRRVCYMLQGPKGLYQFQDACRLAEKFLNGSMEDHPDVLVFEPDNGKLDLSAIEQMSKKLLILPSRAERFVFLINGAECFSIAAQNKLLKVLEDGDAFFLLVCYGNMLSTIKSRSVIIPYRPYTLSQFLDTGQSEEEYSITGGCPDLSCDEGLIQTFQSVGAGLKKNDIRGVLEALHLIKEKDKDSFFERYRSYVPSLFEYMGKLVMGINRLKQAEFAANAALACSSKTYVAADFFKDVVIITDTGR